MAPSEILFAIGCGIIVLVLYTYVVIDIAATVAIKRLTQDLEEVTDDDMVDELDRMWNQKRDDHDA